VGPILSKEFLLRSMRRFRASTEELSTLSSVWGARAWRCRPWHQRRPPDLRHFGPNIGVSICVERSSVAVGQTTVVPINAYPDVDIDRAKFVFLEGQAQAVTCPNVPVKTCAPSCYVCGFKGGDCTVSAVIDGYAMEGQAVVLGRGRCECTRQGPNLVCTGP
jgi:hypothetical protein